MWRTAEGIRDEGGRRRRRDGGVGDRWTLSRRIDGVLAAIIIVVRPGLEGILALVLEDPSQADGAFIEAVEGPPSLCR
jgi:hypothetical protein